MSAKHTPGPWMSILSNVHGPCGVCVACAGEAAVYADESYRIEEDEAMANARLIAAAPKLLEACEAEEDVDTHWSECDECDDDGSCCETQEGLIVKARDLRRAAIAAARGEVKP